MQGGGRHFHSSRKLAEAGRHHRSVFQNVSLSECSGTNNCSLCMDDIDTIREWLKHVPDRLLSAESGRRNSKRRRSHRGGRPKAERLCPYCSARWVHAISANTHRHAKKGQALSYWGLPMRKDP
jgi:hypothetical protein